MDDGVISIRQDWGIRVLRPARLIVFSVALWLKTLALMPGRFAIPITLLGMTLVACYSSSVLGVFRAARNKLILGPDRLTLLSAGADRSCAWSEVTELRRRDLAAGGGIRVVCLDSREIDLNDSWTLPREKLLSLLVERCRPSCRVSPPLIIGVGLQFAPGAGKLVVTALMSAFLLPLILFVLVMLMRRHG